jgi:hypothetical protein
LGCSGCEGGFRMHVRKSILIAGTLVILLLTAALAYVLGKTSQVAIVVDRPAQIAVSNQSTAQPEVTKVPASVAPKTDTLPAVQPLKSKPSTNVPRPFNRTEQRLIDRWSEAMEWCRGSYSQSKEAEEWCPKYSQFQDELNTVGICYGHNADQSAADYRIHRCRKGSYRD